MKGSRGLEAGMGGLEAGTGGREQIRGWEARPTRLDLLGNYGGRESGGQIMYILL